MEKFLSSVALMLIPILITYFSKKNKNNVHKNILDEGQKKVAFINSYYETLSKLSNSSEIALIKPKLSLELDNIKKEVDALDEEFIKEVQKINLFQKLFLTFKPLSFLGWVWAILFYIFLIFTSFAALGSVLDVDGNFSATVLKANLQDQGLVLGMFIYLFFILMFRWFGMITYRKNSKNKTPLTI